jgi:Family of unknown function (DUF6208)
MNKIGARRSGRLSLALEIPLAIASLIFYRLMRALMRPLIVLNARRNAPRARQWSVLSGEALKNKLVLPGIMTTGPRWNTHAVIAAAGPFDVRRSIAVDTEAALGSAEAWTIVVYTFPDQRTAGHIGSQDAPFASHWVEHNLPAGRYTLAVRYYRWMNEPRLPEVRVDGTPLVPELKVTSDINAFYAELRQRRGPYYRWLHFYVFTMLRFRHRLPQRFVERELLPMGNPETQFRYGILYCGESLRVEAAPDMLADYDVYLTVYTRDSFPSSWGQIQPATYTTPPVNEDSFYLVRIHRRRPSAPAPIGDRLVIEAGAGDRATAPSPDAASKI